MNYVVVDIETTGLSRSRHKITEIGAVKYKNGRKAGEFQSLVNPQVPIPTFITKLTGISNEMVKDAEPIQKVLPKFLKFIGNLPIVAHNASFDYGFLNYNCVVHLDTALENPKLCTRKLANRLLPDLPRKKLSHIASHLGIEHKDQHRALGDVKATALIFKEFLGMLEEKQISGLDLVERFEKSPIRR